MPATYMYYEILGEVFLYLPKVHSERIVGQLELGRCCSELNARSDPLSAGKVVGKYKFRLSRMIQGPGVMNLALMSFGPIDSLAGQRRRIYAQLPNPLESKMHVVPVRRPFPSYRIRGSFWYFAFRPD